MQLKPKAEDEPQDEEDSKDVHNPGDPPGIPFVSQSSTTINQSKGASPRRDQLQKLTPAGAIYMSMSNLRPVSKITSEQKGVLRKQRREANKSYTS